MNPEATLMTATTMLNIEQYNEQSLVESFENGLWIWDKPFQLNKYHVDADLRRENQEAFLGNLQHFLIAYESHLREYYQAIEDLKTSSFVTSEQIDSEVDKFNQLLDDFNREEALFDQMFEEFQQQLPTSEEEEEEEVIVLDE